MHIRQASLLLAILALGLNSAWAADSGIVNRPEVSLQLANQLLAATLASCHAAERSAVAVVVDRGGNPVALQRDDNVGPHNTLAAQRKAYTALSTKTPTGLLAERARSNPQAANLNTLDELLLLGGGLPLQAQGQVIGAIGVAGAGGAEMDERCAQQAIDQVLGKTH